MLNEIKEKLRSEKAIIIGVVLLLVGCFIAWDLFSNGSNNGGIEPIRQQLDETSKYQQSIDKRLDAIEKGLSNSQNRLNGVSERIVNNTERVITVERRIEDSQARVDESQRIIIESQSIIDNVRKRN